MMSFKKIFAILIILSVISLIGFLFIAKQKGYFNKIFEKNEIKPLTTRVLLNNIDYITKEQLNGKILFSGGLFNSTSYTFNNSWSEGNLLPNQQYTVECYSRDHYLRQGIYTSGNITDEEDVFECELFPYGTPNFELLTDNENLENGTLVLLKPNQINKLKVNIGVYEGYFQKSAICFKWTPGIIYVSIKDRVDICEYPEGWLNYSMFFPENKTYYYYPNV